MLQTVDVNLSKLHMDTSPRHPCQHRQVQVEVEGVEDSVVRRQWPKRERLIDHVVTSSKSRNTPLLGLGVRTRSSRWKSSFSLSGKRERGEGGLVSCRFFSIFDDALLLEVSNAKEDRILPSIDRNKTE
mmetsp:Transcript_13909/g.33344  ORF Transcript_13909/g.33344 Transcript_13909/m.33344 type:complete len:129 (+) Transcript_13909:504-890(+)